MSRPACSRPAWARGLKLAYLSDDAINEVAPRVGAWIETFVWPAFWPQRLAPRVGAWIETMSALASAIASFAPRVGAWIETITPPIAPAANSRAPRGRVD